MSAVPDPHLAHPTRDCAHTHRQAPGDALAAEIAPGARGPVTRVALLLLRAYKGIVSPMLPPACRFVPTCSEYGYEAIAKYGIITGGRLAIWRVLRCNPFGRGGYDPVP
ncbi:MAG: membrane protein insertion efficiency factor YidD [Thermomicrobiales bacterium]|nr:membrane protein insertion efficiency factor YidD [Thermomicrobiales bacterium]